MRYYDRTVGNNRAEVVRCGTIVSRLRSISNLQKRTKNKDLFKDTRDKMRKELLEIRKGL